VVVVHDGLRIKVVVDLIAKRSDGNIGIFNQSAAEIVRPTTVKGAYMTI
jgi:hypothetical protein